MKIAIIGQAGTGKTTATDFFVKNGAFAISADKIVKNLYLSTAIKEQIIKNCGSQFLDKEGFIKKRLLRENAFKSYNFLRKLEEIIWPHLRNVIISEINSNKDKKFIVIDCAVFLKLNLKNYIDKTLLITAKNNLKIERIKARDNVIDSEVIQLLNMQKQNLDFKKDIDFIITNNESTAQFLKKLAKLLLQFKK